MHEIDGIAGDEQPIGARLHDLGEAPERVGIRDAYRMNRHPLRARRGLGIF